MQNKIKRNLVIGITLLCTTVSIGGSVALGYTPNKVEPIINKTVHKVQQIEPVSEYEGELIVLPPATEKKEQRNMNSSRLTEAHLSNRSNTAGTRAYTFSAKSPSNVTAYELDSFLEGTNLAGLGEAFVKAELKTGINAVFLTSLATIESGWGTSYIAKTKNNLFGFNAIDSSPTESATTFRSKEECISQVADFIAENYCEPTGRYYKGGTIADIGSLYATNPNWANTVHGQMKAIDKELGKL